MALCEHMSIVLFVGLLVIFCHFQTTVAESKCAKNTNSTCKECIKLSSNCYWCSSSKVCAEYVISDGKNQKGCAASDVYYKQCFVSGNLLIIILLSVGGALLIIVGCCIYCCCCRRCCRKKKDKFEKEDKKLKKDWLEKRQSKDQAKAERNARNEAIRMKYGLKPAASGESRYQRLGDDYP